MKMTFRALGVSEKKTAALVYFLLLVPHFYLAKSIMQNKRKLSKFPIQWGSEYWAPEIRKPNYLKHLNSTKSRPKTELKLILLETYGAKS